MRRGCERSLLNPEKDMGVIIAILHYVLIEKIEPGSSYKCTGKA